jgi:hypothetical protein
MESRGLLVWLLPDLKLNTLQRWWKKTGKKIPYIGYFLNVLKA